MRLSGDASASSLAMLLNAEDGHNGDYDGGCCWEAAGVRGLLLSARWCVARLWRSNAWILYCKHDTVNFLIKARAPCTELYACVNPRVTMLYHSIVSMITVEEVYSRRCAVDHSQVRSIISTKIYYIYCTR